MELMVQEKTASSEKLAIVLIAHGSRNAEANADATYFAEQLQHAGVASQVIAAYLELAEPTIPQGVETVLANKPQLVVLLPYFLSAGVHVRRDITDMCLQFKESHPRTNFHLAEPIGRHHLMGTILADRLREVLFSHSSD
jgi:sirohydrochlorin ferrochelatase